MKRGMPRYFYMRKADGKEFERIDTLGLFRLEWFIGETLAEAMCRDNNDLEMVRLWRIGTGEHVIVQKQLNRISVWIDSKTWPTKPFENGCDTQNMQ